MATRGGSTNPLAGQVTWINPATGRMQSGTAAQRSFALQNPNYVYGAAPAGAPAAAPGYDAMPDPSIPAIDFNTGIVTYPTTYAPSQLASQESGAIGAASIKSQMPKITPSTFASAATKKVGPKPAPYQVKSGDTLSSIAKKNNMSLSQLMKLNPKFKQQAKYQGGRTIFSGTTVNLTPKPAPKKKPSPFSPGQFRMAEERSMRQPTPTLQNPLGK